MYSINNKDISISPAVISSNMVSATSEKKATSSNLKQTIIAIACISFFPLVYLIGNAIVNLIG